MHVKYYETHNWHMTVSKALIRKEQDPWKQVLRQPIRATVHGLHCLRSLYPSLFMAFTTAGMGLEHVVRPRDSVRNCLSTGLNGWKVGQVHILVEDTFTSPLLFALLCNYDSGW